jgi:CRISPR/Cas system-associated exonuclease Cas4 (RecB family)
METMVVSYSDVSSYLRCPRALQLKHAGTPEQDKPVMAVGRAMHRLHEAIVAAGWGPEDEEAATTGAPPRWSCARFVAWWEARQ